MRIVLQRVRRARVTVESREVARIGSGLVLLVGMIDGDTAAGVARAAAKIATLRVFEDGDGKMNLDVGEVSGEVLVVSQFTLAASTRRGRRPSFVEAMDPEGAKEHVDAFATLLREEHGLRVAEGEFGASMQVELINDGPVTLVLDF